MGNVTRVLIRDLSSVNFDKVCRLALELQFVRQAPLDAIEVFSEGPFGPNDFDIDGDDADRKYWERGSRSMTEAYAIRMGLGVADASGGVLVESPVVGPGLASLCQSLAEHHGKVPGKKGGRLNAQDTIMSYASQLSVLPRRAGEILERVVGAVAVALGQAHPVATLVAMTDPAWDEIGDALRAAGLATYRRARDVIRDLQAGRYALGHDYPLAGASGSPAPRGVTLEEADANFARHFWAAAKAVREAFPIACLVVRNPGTGRIAVQCSTQEPVDIGPVVESLALRFPSTEFAVNEERKTIVWDPRSGTPEPPKEQIDEIIAARLAFRPSETVVPPQRFGAKIGDVFRPRQVMKRR